jgi:CheY-like chemotaxis protein
MSVPRILIIDDCKLTLAIARDILVRGGYEAILAETGIEANRYIYGAAPPALILIDVEMPLLRGDRKVRLLKETPASRHIPVVLMSQKTPDELAALCQASGADDYLVKPLREHALLAMVRTFS